MTACTAKGTTVAQAAYGALRRCVDVAWPVQPKQEGQPDLACSYDASTSQYLDDAACTACLATAQASGGSCGQLLAVCEQL